MNLIIDVGNTLTKLAVVSNNNIVYSNRYNNLNIKDVDEILNKYSVLKSIVSIVGLANEDTINHLKDCCKTIVLDRDTKIPIKNQYSTPKTLGYDRIAVCAGANYLYPQKDILVIDAGTAITYETITSEGIYLGGAISPGISLRFKSLNDHTSKLPYLEKNETYPLIGTNTNDCIYSGILNGVVAEVDNYISEIKTKFPSIYVLLTGGDSNFFANKLKNSIFVNQNLMIVGLNRILEFNV